MAAKNQILANRMNALQGTRPKTKDGKSALRHNALKHGILASDVVLPDESHTDFLQFRDQFWDYLKPVGPVEEEELRKLVDCGWRLRRCARIDTGTFENNLQRDQKPGMKTPALAFASGAVAFATLTRFKRHLSRQYIMTLRELERLQDARAGQPMSMPAAPDIEIGLTVEEQVYDALHDLKARLGESERMKRPRLLEQLLPQEKESIGKQPNGGPYGNQHVAEQRGYRPGDAQFFSSSRDS